MPGIVHDVHDEVAVGSPEQFRHCAAEVICDALSHVRLGQALQPVAGLGLLVVRLQGDHVRRHCVLGVDAKLRQPTCKPPVAGHLPRRHLTQDSATAQVRREPGIRGHPVERDERAVGEHAE